MIAVVWKQVETCKSLTMIKHCDEMLTKMWIITGEVEIIYIL